MDDRLLIVGAGLAGLTAALEATNPGDDGAVRTWPADRVLLIDKAKGPGGRLATRRIGRAILDHGAQFFTVRSDRFRSSVDVWLDQGLVTEWCRGFGEPDGHPRYRVTGGMRELARHLEHRLAERGVELVTGHRVSALIPGPDRFTAVHDRADRAPDDATAVILTPPLPQTHDILSAGPVPLTGEQQRIFDGSTYHPVLALLTVLDGEPDLPAPGALQRPDDPTFTFVADNRAKGISDEPAVTFHTAPALSARLWPADDATVAETLLPAATELLAGAGSGATIVGHQIKRWRHSGPVSPLDQHCLVVTERPGPLVVAGDAFGGARVEGAFLSGVAAAERIGRLIGS